MRYGFLLGILWFLVMAADVCLAAEVGGEAAKIDLKQVWSLQIGNFIFLSVILNYTSSEYPTCAA
jgi:hypothetical protein